MPLEDRTEAPTPKRREEARGEGRVAKSNDLVSALVLLLTLCVVKACMGMMSNGLQGMMSDTLANLGSTKVSLDSIVSLALSYGIKFAIICLPVALATAAIGFTVNVLQVGFKVTPKAIMPKFSNINPASGITRMFTAKSAVELLKSVAKVGVVTYFVYTFLSQQFPTLIDMAGLSLIQMTSTMGTLIWHLLMRGCMAMLVIGAIDYGYQKFTFEQSLKMTKQEVTEEYKRSEGDPKIKGRIRQRQMEMARRRMIQDVPKADVIITNPTHFAVAIQYDGGSMSAPKVIAKGQRLLALKIREVAGLHGIPIVENPPIARLLYKTVEVGQQIPEDLYQAVAEILAYVYQLSQKRK